MNWYARLFAPKAVAFGWLFTFIISCPFAGQAFQNRLDKSVLDRLIRNPQSVLDPADLRSAETVYNSFALQRDLAPEECLQLARSKAIIVFSITQPETSSLYSIAIDDARETCQHAEASVHFILGQDCFRRGAFDDALDHFNRILEDNTADEPLIMTTEFNLIAVHNELENLDEAIEVANQAIARSMPTNGLFFQHMNINLAGLYNSKSEHFEALRILKGVDEDPLDEYWLNIKALNEFIAHRHLLNAERCKELWFERVRFIQLPLLNENLMEELVGQALLQEDLLYLNDILQNEESRGLFHDTLEKMGSWYAQLFAPNLAEEEVNAIWKDMVITERAYHDLASERYLGIISGERDELMNLESNLILAQNEKDEWKRISTLTLLGINAFVVIYLVWFLRRKNKNRIQLEQALASKTPHHARRGFKMTANELRILGDAIAFGKRTADAMLVLQRLNENTDNPLSKKNGADLAKLPEFRNLNKSERLILEHLVSGFESKEIARLIGCSASHVYNVRSRIRQTFEIPPEEGIEEWMHAQLQESPDNPG